MSSYFLVYSLVICFGTMIFFDGLIPSYSASINPSISPHFEQAFHILTSESPHLHQDDHVLRGSDGKQRIQRRGITNLNDFRPGSINGGNSGIIDVDTCSHSARFGKYFPNLSSNCTSYYFCAGTHQITYLCEPGYRFNGEKCTNDFNCPKIAGIVNPCASSPNGYYSNKKEPTKYFYCYHKSKVIELRCSNSKIFMDQYKKCMDKSEINKIEKEWSENSCIGKNDGFYPNLESSCTKYYYCIDQIKTELECSNGQIFNGDICVSLQTSSFKCPVPKKNRPSKI